jgi:mannose-6-phosphate isomerase
LNSNNLLILKPEYRDYVWGGHRLRPDGQLTAEAWVVYEADRIANGPLAGRTLADASLDLGEALLGKNSLQLTGKRFPLLIKLLDCAQWLSLQVHPNDEQAQRLEGPGFFGKTEAWHIIAAEKDAQLIAGLQPNTTAEQVTKAIRNQTITECAQYHTVQKGDSIYMPPGTIHALGPGLLLYEVQQTSDLTYRVYDWGRPETANRKLHIDKSLAVVNPEASSLPVPLNLDPATNQKVLVSCPYFTLEYIRGTEGPVHGDTQELSFHALTVIEGQTSIQAGAETISLKRFDTILIPASCGEYTIQPQGACTLLKSSVGALE